MEKFKANDLNGLADRLKLNAEIYDVVVCDADDEILVEEEHQESIVSHNNKLTDLFDSPIGDKKDTVIKQLMCASAIIAQKKGETLPIMDDSSIGVASHIDEAYTRTKLAYQVGCGKLRTAHDAVDLTIEKTSARIISAVEIATKSIVGKCVNFTYDALNSIVGSVCPPAGVIMRAVKDFVVRPLSSWIGEKCTKVIRTGFSKVKKFVKESAHKVIEKGRSIFSKIKKFVFG